MAVFHIFDFYRRLLMIVLTVYAVVRIVNALYNWRRQLAGAESHKRVMRHYVLAMLLSTRFRRFWPDLAQIAVLLIILLAILAAHGLVLEWK
jgi:hypothetical protein